jgi:hypothetical protein
MGRRPHQSRPQLSSGILSSATHGTGGSNPLCSSGESAANLLLLRAFEPSADGSGCFAVSTRRCGLRRPVIDFCRHPGSGAIKSMLKAQIAKALQLLDLMLEYLPTTATGRAAVMMTGMAATAWSALLCGRGRDGAIPSVSRADRSPRRGYRIVAATLHRPR